ncbi:hypothetical protein [Mycobacterium sp.]|uniref:hypothetical protein n=1 Tax=Mycobacterium sp. TaxID=1785 RepID=UPI0025F023E8|nr:hypothetical protein [Mycobacterium sp.]
MPRSLVNRATRGLAKIVAARGSGRILGVHITAEGTGNAIQAAVYAAASGMTTPKMASRW